MPEWMVKLSDSFYEAADQFYVDFRIIFGVSMVFFFSFIGISFIIWVLYTLFLLIKKKVLAFWEKKRNA